MFFKLQIRERPPAEPLLKTTEEEDKEEEEAPPASRAAANEISTDAAVLSELDCILALKEEQTAHI